MIHLHLIGIGSGNPDHLTRQAIRALNAADLVLIPRKGPQKADLAELRLAICAEVITNPRTMTAEFDLPIRDATSPDYPQAVEHWHDAIAGVWSTTIAAHPTAREVALLVWGDPSLYDSTLRIAARLDAKVTVIPGITSLQTLTAAHAIPLNDIGGPVTITTGRQLSDHGWPPSATTLAVMLDGNCAFQTIDPEGVFIWWGAYVGMAEQIILSGPLAEIGAKIIATRSEARQAHGWIMDIYLLRKSQHIT
jgi:precorrin-6A synthase